MSIRLKLLLSLVVFAAVPLIAMGVISFTSARQSLEETRIAGLESTADLKVARIDEVMVQLRADVRIAQDYFNIRTNLPILIRAHGDQADPDYKAAEKMLDDQLTTFRLARQYLDVVLISPEGLIAYKNNKQPHPAVGDHLSGPGAKAFEAGKKGIYLGEVFVTEVPFHRFAMWVTAPVHGSAGTFLGVVALEVDLDPLFEVVQETTGLGETGETLIASRAIMQDSVEGALFLNPLRHDPEAALTRTAVFGAPDAVPIQEAINGRSGSGESIDYRGEEVVAAWRPIPSVGWGLVTKIDTSEAFRSVTDLRDLWLILGGATLLLSVLVAAAMSRAALRSIRSLEEGTRIIGAGDLGHRTGIHSRDEIGALSLAFDQMAENLETITASRDELDQEVVRRKQIEDQLRLQATAVEWAAHGVVITDRRGIIVWVNPAFTQMTGYSMEEAVGRNPRDLIKSGKQDEAFYQDLWETILAGDSWCGAIKNRRKDGTIYDEYQTITPVKDDQGEITHFVAIKLDVTVQNQAEEALRESEQLNRALVDAIPDMMFRVSGDGTFLGFKPGRNTRSIVEPDRFLGRKVREIMPPELADDQMRVIKRALETGEVQTIEYQLPAAGEVRDFEAQFASYGEDEVLAIARDVTERKLMQQQLIQSEKLATIGTLVAGVAHEVNNPLAGALGHVDLLLRQELDEDLKRDLQVVRQETLRAVAIMRNLLAFSRERKPEKTYISLNEVLESTLALREYEQRVSNVTVRKCLQPDLPKTMVDSAQMQQVFLNLLLNSEQAILDAGDHGVITVRSRQIGDKIRFTLSDDGPGIPLEILSKIFDPFFTTKPVGKGSGLGLSICYGIISEHAGSILVSSKPGQGAVFTIELPIITEDDTRSEESRGESARIV